MSHKLAISIIAILATSTYLPAYADDTGYSSCFVEVAVASPPVNPNERVVFNVSNERGTNNSTTLKGGSAPQTLKNLICSNIPYTITATLYSTPSTEFMQMAQGIGQCVLKAGAIVLNEPDNSVSVVFPYDFNCN